MVIPQMKLTNKLKVTSGNEKHNLETSITNNQSHKVSNDQREEMEGFKIRLVPSKLSLCVHKTQQQFDPSRSGDVRACGCIRAAAKY